MKARQRSRVRLEYCPMAGDDDDRHTRAAADLIHLLDSQFEEMSSNVVHAAKDAQEARQNARQASRVAQRYLTGQRGYVADDDDHASDDEENEPLDVTNIPSKDSTDSTAARLAHRHHEDLLQLSLELERTRQQLEAEQMEHDETRTSAMHYRRQYKKVESQCKQLLDERESERHDAGARTAQLERQLAEVHQRLQMADDDAQLAVDLAQANADKREEIEVLLYQALEQLEAQGVSAGDDDETTTTPTKNRPQASPKVVHFDVDQPPAQSLLLEKESPSTSRALVHAGKQVFQQATSPKSPTAGERRRKLRDKLRRLHLDLDTATASPRVGSPLRTPHNSKVALILKESAQQLDLSARLWDDTTMDDDWQLEALARKYCHAVQAKVDRQRAEILELESLCALWEKGTLSGAPDA